MENNYFAYIRNTVFHDEFDQYLACLDKPISKGIIINGNQSKGFALLNQYGIQLQTSGIAKDSYIVTNDNFHASDYGLYHVGAFYSQEISASSAVEVLDPQVGEIILDACASPGGKTCQIANRIGDDGVVISNEKDKLRANTLANNCIDLGLDNTIVLNEDASSLSSKLSVSFDRILVDAPCSGEGMIKKEKDAVLNQWSIAYVEKIANLQLAILNDVSKLLKDNGTLVYSTCTFNTIENEGVVLRFLDENPNMSLDLINVNWGRKGLVINDCLELAKCRRILPMDGGEGHFIARFIKHEASSTNRYCIKSSPLSKQQKDYIQSIIPNLPNNYFLKANRLFGCNQPLLDMGKAKVIKYYTHLGEFATKRFEPSYDLSRSKSFNNKINHYAIDLIQLNHWLKGYPINANVKGWVILTYLGYPISFGKGDGNVIKNKYPKAKRINYDVV